MPDAHAKQLKCAPLRVDVEARRAGSASTASGSAASRDRFRRQSRHRHLEGAHDPVPDRASTEPARRRSTSQRLQPTAPQNARTSSHATGSYHGPVCVGRVPTTPERPAQDALTIVKSANACSMPPGVRRSSSSTRRRSKRSPSACCEFPANSPRAFTTAGIVLSPVRALDQRQTRQARPVPRRPRAESSRSASPISERVAPRRRRRPTLQPGDRLPLHAPLAIAEQLDEQCLRYVRRSSRRSASARNATREPLIAAARTSTP